MNNNLTTNAVARTSLLLAIAGSLLLVAPADAQHLRYKAKSKMKIEGLGFLSGLLGGNQEEEVSIYDLYKRVDEDDRSTITDIPAGQMIFLNHDDDEFSVVTFEEMAEMVDQAMEYGRAQVDEARGDMESDEEMPEYTADFDLEVRTTGKTKKIEGFETEQKVLIIETRFQPKDEAAADSLPSGSFYVVTDMWQTRDAPELAVERAFNEALAESMQSEMMETDMASIMTQLLDADPRVGEAMEKAEEELRNVEGATILSTMYFVTVPAGMELDVEAALGEKEEEDSGGGGFGGFLKQATKAAGIDSGDEEEAEESEPTQSVIFSMERKLEDVSDKERDMDYFRAPSDYDQVEYEMPSFTQQDN